MLSWKSARKCKKSCEATAYLPGCAALPAAACSHIKQHAVSFLVMEAALPAAQAAIETQVVPSSRQYLAQVILSSQQYLMQGSRRKQERACPLWPNGKRQHGKLSLQVSSVSPGGSAPPEGREYCDVLVHRDKVSTGNRPAGRAALDLGFDAVRQRHDLLGRHLLVRQLIQRL